MSRMAGKPDDDPPETYRLLHRTFIRPGITCCGTISFLAADALVYLCTAKFSWRYDGLTAEGAPLERVTAIEEVFGIVRILNHDEEWSTSDMRGGIMSGERMVPDKETG